jgi:hypothetical protein
LAVLVNFHEIITSVYVDSDAAMAGVLGQAIDHIAAGSYVSLGNHPWYEEWLFLLATRGAPSHRQLWEIAPALWSLSGLAIFAWTARAVFGSLSAGLCGAALLCVGAFGRFCFLAINWHSLSLVHTILVALAAVWLVGRIGEISWRPIILLALGLGVVSALPTASDSLFPFWALAPLVAASVAVAWRAPSRERVRLATFVAIVLTVAATGGVIVASSMRASGVTARELPITLVAVGRIGHNIVLLGESYAYLGGGRLTAPRLNAQSVLAPASASLVLIALIAGLAQLVRVACRSSLRRKMTARALFYVAFWGSSLLTTSVVFICTDAPRDALSGRYLLGGYAAIAALLPLSAARSARARLAVTAGVCAFALIATYQLSRRPFDVIKPPDEQLRFPGPSTAAALARFAQRQHVTYGYGGYWDAEELTWSMNFSVQIRPVRVCPGSRTYALCDPQLGMVSSWYTPKPRTRSLLVVDTVGTSYNGILGRDAALGKPLAARRLDVITVYAYPYDIASRLATPRCRFTWAHPC